jgi:hypothetical protein
MSSAVAANSVWWREGRKEMLIQRGGRARGAPARARALACLHVDQSVNCPAASRLEYVLQVVSNRLVGEFRETARATSNGHGIPPSRVKYSR